ncbi:MAG: DUF1501 domain-containing protein [Planctomycetaceae bacterium]
MKFDQCVLYAEHPYGQRPTAGWDTHGFNNTRMYPILKARHLPITEQTLPTLLTDLDERGLLDQTLVVWMGEFGRTPKINASISRDHWPQCYTVLLAGGGVQRGGGLARSGGEEKHPACATRCGRMTCHHVLLLGIDPHTEFRDVLNRPFPIAAGEVITGVLA